MPGQFCHPAFREAASHPTAAIPEGLEGLLLQGRGEGLRAENQLLWDVGHCRMHLETMLYLKLKIKGEKQFNK